MRPVSAGARRARSPMKRIRTPLASSSATSRSSDSRKSCIRRPTSPAGRCQFSLEKAKSVSAPTPHRTDSSMVARTALVPARCPAARGSERCSAQRPLPSMITATWRGTVMPPAACVAAAAISDLQQLFLFLGQHRVDVVNVPVRELLDLVLGAAIVVLGDEALLQHFLELVHEVVPDGADRDARTFRLVACHLREFLAALLGHRRQRQPDDLARRVGREAEVGLQDRLLDRLHRGLVPGRHDERAGILDVDAGDLVDRHLAAVVVDLDAIEQPRVRAARAHLPVVVLEERDALAHALHRVAAHFVLHVRPRYSPLATSVPTSSPSTIRSRSPSFIRLNTLSGSPLSRHITIAVASITPRRSSSTLS